MCLWLPGPPIRQFGRWRIRPVQCNNKVMMKPNQSSSRRGVFARIFLVSSVALNLAFVPWTDADVIDSSLKARLNFDAAPAADVVVDTSPAGGHPGTNSLATWVSGEAGRNGVMRFDPTSPSQITVSASPDFNSPVGSITFWVKSDVVNTDPNPYAMIFDRRGAGGDVLFQGPDGHVANQAQQASGGAANSQTTTISLTDSNWHHLAYVYDQAVSGSVALYVDGVLDASGPNNLAWAWAPDQQIELGKSHEGFWAAYNGFLDDFRIYNRKLTAAEVGNIAGLDPAPQIRVNAAGQPQSITTGEKDAPAFTVKAVVVNGDPAQLGYQWQRDSVDISGATNAAYSLTVAAADSGRKFRCRLTYPGATTVTTDEATLTVVTELSLTYTFAAQPVADVIVDSTTNSLKHDGLNIGAIWAASEDVRTGVMRFDGAAPSQITVAPASELDLKRGTIAFWMKSIPVTPPDPNAYTILFDRRAASGDVIYLAPSGNLANQVAGGINSQTTGANLTDGRWRHVAYLYDQNAGGSVSFYVDGVLDTTGVNSGSWSWVTNQQIELGKSHDGFWAGYNGFLDEFRIYNRVLTPAEIATLAGLGPQPKIVINRQPASLATGVNDTPTLGVTATVVNGISANLRYQWQKDGADIPAATNSAYSFTVAAADNGKKFICQLSYTGATNVTSAEATLTVLPEFVVHFAFDAAPQADVIVDGSPGANNGVNVGATWVASQDGRTGVMSFNGDPGDQITVAAATNLNSTRGTIAFWMKSSATTPLPNPYAMLVDRRAMPNDGVPVTGGDVLFQLPNGPISDQAEVGARVRANAFSSTVNPTDGAWHHVAFVYDQTARGYVGFYVDGVADGTRANNQSWYWVPEQTIELCKSHDPYWSGYTGFLDDFRIYNRVLSTSEISQLAGVVTPPVLSLSLAGSTATLSWSQTGFFLQENSDLGNPTGWTNVPNGGVSPVMVTVLQTGARFYRLRKP